MQKHVGSILLLAVLSLVALGLIVLFSTSAKFAAGGSVAMYAYLRKQALWLVLGGAGCFALSKVDYRTLGRYAPHCVALSAFLMLACFAPYVGKTVKGAARWIEIAGFTAQPSEFAKLAFLFFLAFWLARNQEFIREFKRGFAIPACVGGGLSLILLKQRDLGSILMLLLMLAILMACAGVPKRYLLPVPLVGIASILAIAWSMPERRGRLFAFMDLEAYKQTEGYQVYQGIIALGSGGPLGLGLGNSRQKMYYLPESHTDFIFPIIGEEMGMWIALAVVAAFLIIALCGGWISLHAPDSAGVLLGVGVTSFLSIQAIMNLAVVTSMMPAKGVPLPFISYGGSNLLVCLACVGLLFNLQRNGVYEVPTAQEQLLPRRGRPRM